MGEAERAGGTRRSVKVALIVSVGLNLLVAGIVAGGLLGGEHPEGRPMPIDEQLGPLGAAFTREDRAAMRRDAARTGTDFGALKMDFRADMDALIATLKADPWDPDAVRRQLAQMRANGEQRAVLGEQVMLQRLSTMTGQERRQYAERLRDRMEHGPLRRRDGDGREP